MISRFSEVQSYPTVWHNFFVSYDLLFSLLKCLLNSEILRFCKLQMNQAVQINFSVCHIGRGRGRGRGRGKEDSKEWVPVTKLGRLVRDGKIRNLEEIYLFSLPIKEFDIIDFFIGTDLNDEVIINRIPEQFLYTSYLYDE